MLGYENVEIAMVGGNSIRQELCFVVYTSDVSCYTFAVV